MFNFRLMSWGLPCMSIRVYSDIEIVDGVGAPLFRRDDLGAHRARCRCHSSKVCWFSSATLLCVPLCLTLSLFYPARVSPSSMLVLITVLGRAGICVPEFNGASGGSEVPENPALQREVQGRCRIYLPSALAQG